MDIKSLIGETTDYEKKVELELRKPKSWCKSVSAFANGLGGILIFGIDNNDNIVGLEDARSDSEKISEQVKSYLEPIPEFNLSIQSLEKKKIIVLEVYKGQDTPYFYVKDGNKIAFSRLGNQSVPVDTGKLKTLILKGANLTFDGNSTQYKFSDFSFTKLNDAYKDVKGLDLRDSDYESFGLVDVQGNLTNAGALLADNTPISQSRIFCTRWDGLTKAGGIFDAIDNKEYSDSLVQLLDYGVNFIKNNSKTSFKKTANKRIELPDYDERAVFEAIVNALVHRDYLVLGSEIQINIYDDRLTIYSPGGMVDGTNIEEIDISKISSNRRNPIVADVFNRLQLMERRGSGIQKIIENYKEQYLYNPEKEPRFSSENEAFYVELKNLNYKEESHQTVEFKKVFSTLSENQIIVLKTIIGDNSISIREIEEKTDINRSTVNRHINELVKKDLIEKTGTAQKRKYILLFDKVDLSDNQK